MTLIDIYQELKNQPTPASAFIIEIAHLCHRKEIAVRKWLAGDSVPDINIQEKIASHLNKSVEELFPPKIQSDNGI